MLRRRVTGWRAGRTERGPMPAEIWDSAVVLARMYGACKISRAVDLDYKSLRLRVARALEKPGLVGPTFVQLPTSLVADSETIPASGAKIEISAPDGSRMSIHLEAGRGMEAAGIVAAFLRSRA
jgi:hypothetical protein